MRVEWEKDDGFRSWDDLGFLNFERMRRASVIYSWRGFGYEQKETAVWGTHASPSWRNVFCFYWVERLVKRKLPGCDGENLEDVLWKA